jgi:hypothetical protein
MPLQGWAHSKFWAGTGEEPPPPPPNVISPTKATLTERGVRAAETTDGASHVTIEDSGKRKADYP